MRNQWEPKEDQTAQPVKSAGKHQFHVCFFRVDRLTQVSQLNTEHTRKKSTYNLESLTTLNCNDIYFFIRFLFRVSSVTWSCSSLTRMRCWIHGLFFSCQNCCYRTDNHLCTNQTNKQTNKHKNKIEIKLNIGANFNNQLLSKDDYLAYG